MRRIQRDSFRSLLRLSLSRYQLALLALLTAVTVVTLGSAGLTYKKAHEFSEDSLKLQTLGIAVSLEATLASGIGGKEGLFRDIITEGRWEGIAFIALYDSKGKTLLHSNENLVGRLIKDESLIQVQAKGEPHFGYQVLGTGERVFVLDFPVHIRTEGRVLRLALHTYPVEGIIRHARLHISSMLLVLLLLWVLGFFLMRTVTRSEALKQEMADRERLAVLGQMASVMAHEIRNPLGSIKGFAQYLLEQEKMEGGACLSGQYLEVIVNESQRLEGLTEDLLLYAKPVESKPTDFVLKTLLEETVRLLSPACNKANVTLNAPEVLELTADRDRLKQALFNILQNAMDAAGQDGQVEVSALKTPRGVEVAVKDNGPGMDPETLANAFKPFFTTKTRGTGLGLAIVDKLVSSMGGRVELESSPGTGTLFRIILPV